MNRKSLLASVEFLFDQRNHGFNFDELLIWIRVGLSGVAPPPLAPEGDMDEAAETPAINSGDLRLIY